MIVYEMQRFAGFEFAADHITALTIVCHVTVAIIQSSPLSHYFLPCLHSSRESVVCDRAVERKGNIVRIIRRSSWHPDGHSMGLLSRGGSIDVVSARATMVVFFAACCVPQSPLGPSCLASLFHLCCLSVLSPLSSPLAPSLGRRADF